MAFWTSGVVSSIDPTGNLHMPITHRAFTQLRLDAATVSCSEMACSGPPRACRSIPLTRCASGRRGELGAQSPVRTLTEDPSVASAGDEMPALLSPVEPYALPSSADTIGSERPADRRASMTGC